jgi:protein gp37
VEDRKYGLPRIGNLRQPNAAVRFLSIEPLLEDLGRINLPGINWVIVGGESGPGARPMKKEWVISLKDQCRKNRIPFFFKQWGGVRKATTGRKLEGRTYDEFPSQVQNPVLSAEACRAIVSEIETGWRSNGNSSSVRLPMFQPAVA